MNRKQASLLVFLIVLGPLAGCGTVKHEVTKIEPHSTKRMPAHGIVYVLPRTQVIVEVPVTLIVRKPGSFTKEVDYYDNLDMHIKEKKDKLEKLGCNLDSLERRILEGKASKEDLVKEKKCKAIKEKLTREEALAILVKKEKGDVQKLKPHLERLLYYLDIDYPVKYDPTTKKFKIGTPIISFEAIPDPNHIYLVHIKGGYLEDRSLNLTLTEKGFLVGGTSEAKNRSADLMFKTIEVVAKVAGAALPMAAAAVVGRRPSEEIHPNPYTKAIGVANAIADVRKKMLAVKAGTRSTELSPDSIKLMLEELKKHERALEAYFWKMSVITWKGRVEFQPERDEAPPRLFDVVKSDKKHIKGLVNGTSLVEPIPDAYKGPIDDLPANWKTIEYTIKQKERENARPVADFIPDIEEKGMWPTRAKDLGFRYRIPGEAMIQVKVDNIVLVQKLIPIAQFGKVVALPSDTGSTATKYSIEMFTEVGALKKILINSAGIQASTIEGAGAAADAAVAAIAAQKKAKSEVTQLKKEVELLKLRKEKQKLEDDLSMR